MQSDQAVYSNLANFFLKVLSMLFCEKYTVPWLSYFKKFLDHELKFSGLVVFENNARNFRLR